MLDGGELVTKDCDAPVGLAPSTVSVLDPETLLPVAPPLRLPEPSIARLASDGDSVIAVGTTTVFRLRLERAAGRIVVDERWQPRFGPAPGRSYGWDPVISDEHVLWMDNGRNHTDRTMLGTGESPDPVRLWWVRLGGFAHAGHLIVYPDTRELVVQDWKDVAAMRRPLVRRALSPAFGVLAHSARARRASRDQLVVLDLDTGDDKARVGVPSPSQGFLFPAPGFERDVYYQSLTTIARVAVCARAADA